MFKRILMAYNGSRVGKSALLACCNLAGFGAAENHLLAVATVPSSALLGEGFPPDELFEQVRTRAQEVLEEGISQLKERGFAVTGHLAVGEPVEQICKLAADLKSDLIVVGHSRKMSLLSRWWQGSVGKSLIDNAPCSVLVVRTEQNLASEPKA